MMILFPDAETSREDTSEESIAWTGQESSSCLKTCPYVVASQHVVNVDILYRLRETRSGFEVDLPMAPCTGANSILPAVFWYKIC